MINVGEGSSFFLFGPRGTGKTTWVRSAFPRGLYIDMLEAELFNSLTANPQRLADLIPPGFEDWIVIDEVQRVPHLLHEVHRLIERHRYRFILTGSSARSLRKKGVNLLAGRALTHHMHPLTAIELDSDFSLTRALDYGLLPAACTMADPRSYLESYVRTYLEEEVRNEGLTRNLSAFARFLEIASFSQGSVLSIAAVARESGIARKVAEHYFTILEDLLIAHRIPAFVRKAKRRVVLHPKFYLFDTGVYRTLRPSGPLDAPEEAQGPALETLILQNLVAVNDAFSAGYSIHYWRTTNGAEVDFVLYGNRGLLAFEVKRSGHVSDSAFSGLRTFLKDYPSAEAYMIYGGERKEYRNGITLMPAAEFLRNLKTILCK